MGSFLLQLGSGGAREFVGSLLGLFLLALLLILLVSPFESLQWWAGWVDDDEADDAAADDRASEPALVGAPAPIEGHAEPRNFVIFLPGVGALNTDVDPWEQRLVDRLALGLPDTTLLAGLFPFTVRDNTLLDRRRTAGVWRWLARVRESRPSLIATLIDWRNLTQVFVSMDPRYGPIFNLGVARKLLRRLAERGYRPGSGAPVYLIGYSGGAQVALGASLYLAHHLHVPMTVISLGGVLGDDPALQQVQHLYHLWGSSDLESRLATLAIPARWPKSTRSRWNQAIASGRLTGHCMGPMKHTGPGGYLDPDVTADDGRSFLEHTAATMVDIIKGSPPAAD